MWVSLLSFQTCAQELHTLMAPNRGIPSLDMWTCLAAAAAAKSLQLCLTVWPHRQQPTRLCCPWDSSGKNTGVGCHFLLQCMKVKRESEVAQSCPTLHNPMDCSLPGSSIHGILQARILEWGAIAFSEVISGELLFLGDLWGYFWGRLHLNQRAE